MIDSLTDVARPSTDYDVRQLPAVAVDADGSVPLLSEAPGRKVIGRRSSVGLMAAGIVLALGAAGLVATQWRPAPVLPATAAAPAAGMVITGPESVAVHVSGFDPHESSTWHTHTGLHAVAILSGTLTVYGPDCVAVRYGAGQSFVGGQNVHVARNETDKPVQFTETILYPAGLPLESFVVPAGPPAGCDVR
jgi:quercetin dioxygenase-like cupin family protein